MSNENSTTVENQQPTILSYVKDLPNFLSLSGLACTILAIYFSITGLSTWSLYARDTAIYGSQLI